jgi:hypothetical protein
MEFLIGLVVGLFIGSAVGSYCVGVLMTGKHGERDYESEQNEPRDSGVDWQNRR